MSELNVGHLLELARRGVVDYQSYEEDSNTFYVNVKMKQPTTLDFIKAYITLAIPAAMLARLTRKLTGRKGTPLERFCMKHYYDMSVKLLSKD